MNKSNITVGIRIRPALPREIQNGQFQKCLVTNQDKILLSLSGQPLIITQEQLESNEKIDGVSQYQFDAVFDQESSQQEIYEKMVQQSVRSVITEGINSTIFAYGQTGSGKTYTMYGKDDGDFQNLGISQRAVLEIFQTLNKNQIQHTNSYVDEQEQEFIEENSETDTLISDIEMKNAVYVSIYQIYNENIHDLLKKDKVNLKTRQDSHGKFYVEGLTFKEVYSPNEIFKLMQKAHKNRTSHGTNMNELSSRSHLILTLTVNVIDERDQSLQSSKLNIVDLAGSEKVKDSGVQGQQLKEAQYINKSLFALIQVVDALQKNSKKNIVNYRNSKLTLLLSDSLGGNCKTTLLAMLSPSQEFCNESNNTLNFASGCKQVQNVIKSNKYKNSIPANVPIKKKIFQQQHQIPWKNIQPQIENIFLESKIFDQIHVLKIGQQSSKQAILLHGCPSHSLEFQHYFPALQYMNYQAYAIDMPGYGKSKGNTQSSRSENVLDLNGPGDVVKFVMQELQIKNPVLIGYDWGGAIALKLAIQNSKMFDKIIAFQQYIHIYIFDGVI